MFPIRDSIPSRRTPVVTLSLIVVNVAVFVYQFMLPEPEFLNFIYRFGVVPRRYTDWSWANEVGFPSDGPIPFFTMMFLHGGLLHIIANMWTLWIFGDNVEDRMGSIRFLLFYILCGLASSFTHFFANVGSSVPAVGASGAIAGVLGAYFLMYPFSIVVCLVPIFFIPVFVDIPAILFGILWFVMQVMSGTSAAANPDGGGGVAWWAHIGGFIAGVGLHRFLIIREAPPRIARRPHVRRSFVYDREWPRR